MGLALHGARGPGSFPYGQAHSLYAKYCPKTDLHGDGAAMEVLATLGASSPNP